MTSIYDCKIITCLLSWSNQCQLFLIVSASRLEIIKIVCIHQNKPKVFYSICEYNIFRFQSIKNMEDIYHLVQDAIFNLSALYRDLPILISLATANKHYCYFIFEIKYCKQPRVIRYKSIDRFCNLLSLNYSNEIHNNNSLNQMTNLQKLIFPSHAPNIELNNLINLTKIDITRQINNISFYFSGISKLTGLKHILFFPTISNKPHLSSFFCFPSLKKLNLCHFQSIDQHTLLTILNKFTNLEKLTLHNYGTCIRSIVDTDALVSTLSKICNITYSGYCPLILYNLTLTKISCRSNDINNLNNCFNLKTLSITKCKYAHISNFSQLEYLYISNSYKPMFCDVNIDHLTKLVIHNVTQCMNLFIYKAYNLKVLIFTDLGYLKMNTLRTCTKLEILHTTVDVKDSIGKYLHRLTSLNIGVRDRIEDFSNLTNLKNLTVLNFAKRAHIRIYVPTSVTSLELSEISDLSPFTHLTNLKNLNVGLFSKDNESVNWKSITRFANLKKLELNNCIHSHDLNYFGNLINLTILCLNDRSLSDTIYDMNLLSCLTNLRILKTHGIKLENVSMSTKLQYIKFIETN